MNSAYCTLKLMTSDAIPNDFFNKTVKITFQVQHSDLLLGLLYCK